MSVADRPIGEDDLTASVDGRLAPEREEAVRACLAARPDLATALGEDREILAALRGELARKAAEPIPARLLAATERAVARRERWKILGMAAAACLFLLIGGAAGWAGRGILGGVPSESRERWAAVAQDALSAHRTFSVEIVHPVEVKAAEEDHLKRWLSRRLGRKLVVPELDRYGFQLVGGRLLPAGRDVAALLMYADSAGARLTVYVRCGEKGDSALRFMREGDLASFTWMEQGYGYAVSAAMTRERLQEVAKAVSQDVELEEAKKSPNL